MNINTILSDKVNQAMLEAGVPEGYESQIRQSSKVQFGDYQANGVISAAKKIGYSPFKMATKVIKYLDLEGIANKIEIAAPGFINIFLDHKWLAQQVTEALQLPYLGVHSTTRPQNIVIDYSAPNVAKEMHIGHIRSTIIGDAVARSLEFLGHNVIRANHIGDWGTQFGMLIAYLEQQQNEHNNNDIVLADLEKFYREAKRNYDENTIFADRARYYVVKLQRGDEYCRSMWKKIVDITISQNQKIYDRLNVSLTNKDIMGESFYNNMLPEIVSDLCIKGIAVNNENAIVVFLKEFKNKKGKSMGVIIQKKDGGYLYTTTDIACIKYRYENFHADRIIYYVDSRQHQHLKQVWSIARKANYIPEYVSLEHHAFGMILGKDGRPFKTRDGGTIKLHNLLNEAVKRALKLIKEKNPIMSLQEAQKLAEIMGIGAVKYAELSKNRITNYIFDWDNMLSFEGNTAPYIQYAYTRMLSIFRKYKIDFNNLCSNDIFLIKTHELQLAIHLLQFEETINQVVLHGTPHVMCGYLYELAGIFSSFYEHCPIIFAKNEKIEQSRLNLVALTAKTIKYGLGILGIKTTELM